jgi:hypothetical protein
MEYLNKIHKEWGGMQISAVSNKKHASSEFITTSPYKKGLPLPYKITWNVETKPECRVKVPKPAWEPIVGAELYEYTLHDGDDVDIEWLPQRPDDIPVAIPIFEVILPSSKYEWCSDKYLERLGKSQSEVKITPIKRVGCFNYF